MKGIVFVSFLGCIMLAACDDQGSLNPPPSDSLQVVDAFPDLNFTRPVDLQHAGSNLLYLVEQRGTIHSFVNDANSSSSAIFLDIQDRVDDRGAEEGLLGLAFHPRFEDNGLFYVNYTSNLGTTRISRFTGDQSPNGTADVSSEQVLLEFSQPFSNHNGGQLAFGPDGYLYIAVGDGGSGGDPQQHGQNLQTLLGTILRIDVDGTAPGGNYDIPADNPFIGNSQGWREEIYAYGLRNPWRFSFDPLTGDLWVADVGQNRYEEINLVVKGGNYGWNIMEASSCFGNTNCETSDLQAPFFEYSHDNGDQSITGGFVYRGNISSLRGWYIYADYASGRIWALQNQSGSPQNQLLVDTPYGISTFGIDHQQDLYFCSLEGKIHKLVQ